MKLQERLSPALINAKIAIVANVLQLFIHALQNAEAVVEGDEVEIWCDADGSRIVGNESNLS